MKTVIGSIVVYNPKMNLLIETIDSFLSSYDKSEVYIWDNSARDLISTDLKNKFHNRIHYNSKFKNLGFGHGHNLNFKISQKQSIDYFCILNPDLIIPQNTISELLNLSDRYPNYGLFSGAIYGIDGSLHHVHKKFPSFKSYLLDQINKIFNTQFKIPNYAVQLDTLDQPTSIPILSGCFLFFTFQHFSELNGFDESFFLYFEDYDITYRSYKKNKSLVDPKIKIIHHWQRESHRKLKLKLIHIKSGLYFYWKYLVGKYNA